MNKCIVLFLVLVNFPIYNYSQIVRSVTKIPKLKIEILSGNPKYFKNAKNFYVQFDYSNLKVGEFGDEKSYIEYMRDDAEKRKKGSSSIWESKWISDRNDVYQPKFIELLNKSSNSRLITDTVYKNQQFKLSLHTQFIEIGFNKNFKKSPTYINVVATISDSNNKKEILVISMVNVIGNEVFSSYSDDFRRIEEAYAKCGKELAKFMLKAIY